jgi:hypothetical protein
MKLLSAKNLFMGRRLRMDGWTDGRKERDGTAFRSIDELMDLWVYGWINRFIEG